MSDEPDTLVLRFLRRMDEKVQRVSDDVKDLKLRLTTLETHESDHYAATMSRFDQLETRLDRIERRLDLVETIG